MGYGHTFYIIKVRLDNEEDIYAIRRVSDSWKVKKVRSIATTVFKDNKLVDLDENQVFKVDGKVDYISYQDTIFIMDKANFETTLNYRAGMEKIRDEFVKKIEILPYFVNARDLNQLVGNNVHLLRKLSQADKSAYFCNPTYMKNLVSVVKIKKWPIEFSEEEKIVFTQASVDLVLRLLNNGRLESLINHEEFDVDVKKRV